MRALCARAAAALALLGPGAVHAQNPAAIPDLSAAQWREDLRVFARELTARHRNPYHLVSAAAFDSAVHALDRRIPGMRGYEVVVGIQRLAAMVGDGHTFVGTHRLYRSFPLEASWFGDELRVVRAAPEHGRALGARIEQVDGHPVAQVRRLLGSVIPRGENAWYELEQSARLVMRAELLAALGVIRDPAVATFTLRNDAGERFSIHARSEAPDARVEWASAVADPPLHLRRPGEAFWFGRLSDSQTVYVALRGYAGIEANAAALLAALREWAPGRLVIDMRYNGGGNYTLVRQHLIYKLQMDPRLNREGALYVVTGRGTFSAAMTNATDFRRETEATLVGEPPGARPNGYQELARFTLPNSGLEVFCSVLRYRFQPGDGDAVLPDVRIDPDWAAYRAGRDPVMEWILSRPVPPAQ